MGSVGGNMTPESSQDAASDKSINAPDVIYKIEFSHAGEKKTYKSLLPFDLSQAQFDHDGSGVGETPKPILEIITRVRGYQQPKRADKEKAAENTSSGTKDDSKDEKKDDKKGTSSLQQDDADPLLLKDERLQHVGARRLVVYSPHLLKVLQSLITYYPGQAIYDDSVTFTEGFEPLLQYESELQQRHDELSLSLETKQDDPEKSEEDRKIHRALGVLLRTLQPSIQTILRPIEAKLSRERPVINFNSLWRLFRPGTKVYYTYTDIAPKVKAAGVVIRTFPHGTIKPKRERRSRSRGRSSSRRRSKSRDRSRSPSRTPIHEAKQFAVDLFTLETASGNVYPIKVSQCACCACNTCAC